MHKIKSDFWILWNIQDFFEYKSVFRVESKQKKDRFRSDKTKNSGTVIVKTPGVRVCKKSS